MKPKPLYRGYSYLQFLTTLMSRLVCAGALVYVVPHYPENPPVICVVALLCLLFIFFIAEDEISIYPDKIIHSTNSIAASLKIDKPNVIELNQLKNASLDIRDNYSDTFELITIAIIAALLPKLNRLNNTAPIILETKSGQELQLMTSLSSKEMKKIVALLNHLIQKQN